MNSTIEYIRQLNQASVHLQSDWLERLKQVEVGFEAQVATPEIVLTERTAGITQYAEGEFTPPVTVVNQQDKSGSDLQTPPAIPVRTHSEEPVAPQTPPITPENSVHVVSGMPQIPNDLYSSLNEPITGTEIPMDQLEQAGFVSGSIETQYTGQSLSASGELQDTTAPTGATQATAEPAYVPRATPRKVVQPSQETAVNIPGQAQPSTATNNTNATTKPSGIELESPAILNDIVRPTIMPLRQRPGTDVIDSGEAGRVSGISNIPSETPVPQTPVAETPIESSAVADTQKTIEGAATESPGQMIEMLKDFGMKGDEVFNTNTMTREEVDALIGSQKTPIQETPAVETPAEKNLAEQPLVQESQVHETQVEEIQIEETPPEPQAEQATACEDEIAPPVTSKTCTFPTDKRAERFIYEKTKRQKLVDSIVDQVVERFPSRTRPVIMLIGANREIDVDSAASRVATCMAGRQIGEILLVDGNLKSRQLTSMLALTNDMGISDAFQKNADASQMIVPTDNPRLKIMGAGTLIGPDSEAALPAASTTNNSLKEQFDYTIISGGVAGDTLTDAWSGIVDGVYLLVDMDESDRNKTVETVDYFRKLGARIVGCIATRA